MRKTQEALSVTYMTPPAQHSYEPMVSGLDHVLPQLPLTALPALIGELERVKTQALARLMNERETASTQMMAYSQCPKSPAGSKSPNIAPMNGPARYSETRPHRQIGSSGGY